MFYMKTLQKYVLVLGQQSDDLQGLKLLLNQMRCSVTIAHSADQAVAQTNQSPPYLIIVASNEPHWSQTLVNQLRRLTVSSCVTIVALTDRHEPVWLSPTQNLGFDGFLVNPISNEVLSSLLQSAWIRQACLSA